MAAAVDSVTSDEDCLSKYEEEFKHRYTDEDQEYTKVLNAESSTPPIIESWWVPNAGRRNDRRHNRRSQHPYERHPRDQDRGYRSYEDRGPQSYRAHRPRYY